MPKKKRHIFGACRDPPNPPPTRAARHRSRSNQPCENGCIAGFRSSHALPQPPPKTQNTQLISPMAICLWVAIIVEAGVGHYEDVGILLGIQVRKEREREREREAKAERKMKHC